MIRRQHCLKKAGSKFEIQKQDTHNLLISPLFVLVISWPTGRSLQQAVNIHGAYDIDQIDQTSDIHCCRNVALASGSPFNNMSDTFSPQLRVFPHKNLHYPKGNIFFPGFFPGRFHHFP